MPPGKPAGRQKSRGSSCRGSPVRGSRNASPPGLSGANLLRSNVVADDRPRSSPCRYVGHWYVPVKSGLPSAVRGMAGAPFCAEVATPNAHTTVSASSVSCVAPPDRLIALLPAFVSCEPAVSTFRPSGNVTRPPGGVVRAVFGAKAFDDDRFTELQLILDDASPHQLPGRAARKPPGRHAAVGVLHVEVEPDVRVRPLDLLDDAGHFHGLGVVEFGRERMMRGNRHAAADGKGKQHEIMSS